MKAHSLKIFLFLFLSVSLFSCSQREIFKPLKPSFQKISTGMEVMTLEDRSLPLVEMQFFIRGGSVHDPTGKEGLALIALQTLRLGGSQNRTPQEVEELVESVGGTVEVKAGSEFHFISVRVLKKDLSTILDVLFDLLRKPSFNRRQFELLKVRAKDALLREEEDPFALALKEYGSFVYGKSVWGRKPTIASLDTITYQDVLDFYQKWIYPNRILVAAAGDFSAQEFSAELEKRQEGWNVTTQAIPSVESLKQSYARNTLILPREGLTQSTVLLGHLGARRENPDKYALIVMNFIFGGSGALTSRLGEKIRSDAGKAYTVWSDFGFGTDYGLFRVGAQTALPHTEWVIHAIEEEIKKLTTHPEFSSQEIFQAKKAILTSLFFDFETRFAQVKQLAQFYLWGYPPDYLETFQKKISKVTEKDLQEVARKYLHPDGIKTVIVTDPKTAKQLEQK